MSCPVAYRDGGGRRWEAEAASLLVLLDQQDLHRRTGRLLLPCQQNLYEHTRCGNCPASLLFFPMQQGHHHGFLMFAGFLNYLFPWASSLSLELCCNHGTHFCLSSFSCRYITRSGHQTWKFFSAAHCSSIFPEVVFLFSYFIFRPLTDFVLSLVPGNKCGSSFSLWQIESHFFQQHLLKSLSFSQWTSRPLYQR